jgi:hypothetical protein
MEEFAASVSGESVASRGSGSTTVVSAPIKSQPKSDGAHSSGVFVAIGTLAMVIAIVLIGIPRLQDIADRRSPERSVPSPAMTAPKVSRFPAKKSGSGKLRAAEEYTTLSVRSTPRGVLYVDGFKVGLTPITNHRLTRGTYRLRVEQKGYRTVAEVIVIKGTRPVNRRYALRRQASR